MIDLNKISQLTESLRATIAALPGIAALNVEVVTIAEPRDIAAVPAVRKIGVCWMEGSWEDPTTIGCLVREPFTSEFGVVVVTDNAGENTDAINLVGEVQSILGILLGPPLGDPNDVDPLLRGIRGANIGLVLGDVIKVYGVKVTMLQRPADMPPAASGPRGALLVLRTTEHAL